MLKFLFNLGSTVTILIAVFACGQAGAQPVQWQPRGIGGGGSLFSPSINPAKEDEFYVACDMSQLFHTEDFGLSYEVVDFRQIEASNNSAVRFTRNSNILYSVTYANDMATPVKSIDAGSTWSSLPGADPWEDIYTIHVDYDKLFRHLGMFKARGMYEDIGERRNGDKQNAESTREMVSTETMDKAAKVFKYFMRTTSLEAHPDMFTVVSMVPPAGSGVSSKDWEKYLLMMKMSVYQPILKLKSMSV